MADCSLPADAFKGKRVLVTGHTGFKGGWLCAWLEMLGAQVTGFALPPNTEPNLFNALRLSERLRHIEGDIRDFDSVLKAFQTARPEIVFHLAAQPIVRLSYQQPKATFDTNVGGTVNVLEALRVTGHARALINVTSDKCYENREWIWGYRENDPLGGHDPYSASKGCAELVFAAYQRSFFAGASPAIGVASVRAGNVIGGGDWNLDRIVPDCVRALQQGKPAPVRNPRAVRPWQHVLEPLHGYLILAASLLRDPVSKSGAWNFGPAPENVRTVGQLAETLVTQWGQGQWQDLSTQQASAPHEAGILRLCCDKAITLLDWRPILDFDATLQFVADWYKGFYNDPAASLRLCQSQIQEYTARAARR